MLTCSCPPPLPFARLPPAWIAKIHHQTCHVVYTDYRPTPLQHYMFPSGGDGLHLVVDEKGRFREDNFQKAMASLNAVTVESGLGGASSGGKKGRKGRGKGGKRGPSDLFRIVKMIMERNYDPVIVFSFRCVRVCGVAVLPPPPPQRSRSDGWSVVPERPQQAGVRVVRHANVEAGLHQRR